MKNNRQRTPFIIGFDGTALNPELERHLLEMDPAGLLLFKRNIQSVEQTRRLIIQLHELLGDIMIAIDHEGGIVNRFPTECPVPPAPAALKASGSQEAIRKACELQAELVAYLGFNMNFVPLVDLALFSENQVIGTRAFSGNAEEIAEYAKICIAEHAKRNIGTTAKHFPTHGRTIVDSHFSTGKVIYDRQEQLEQDLLPYRKTIELDVPAVMTAHLTFPFLDQEHPASLSKPILSDLLRVNLGFKGLIISDCVEMEGISNRYEPDSLIELGLTAGVDLFISSFSLKRNRDFQRALKKGYQKFLQRDPGIQQSLNSKVESFTKRFPPATGSISVMPSLDEAIKLHRETLTKPAYSTLANGYRRFHLVELANGEKQGINPDPEWGIATREILARCQVVTDSTQFFTCDEKRFREVLEDCNHRGKTCVLLTTNGYRKEGYSRFMEALKSAHSAIHIALLSPDDLESLCGNEWVTRGFNSCTGIMLAEELNRLV